MNVKMNDSQIISDDAETVYFQKISASENYGTLCKAKRSVPA